MSYPAISLATATVGRYRCPQKRLQTARQPPVYPNSSPRIIAPVTPSPPSAALTPSIPVHRWIRAKGAAMMARMEVAEAALIVDGITSVKAADIMATMEQGKASLVFEQVDAGKAVAMMGEMKLGKAAEIWGGMAPAPAGVVFEAAPVELGTQIVEVLPENTLIPRLPEVSAPRLWQMPFALLARNLPSVPAEHLSAWERPEVATDLPQPEVALSTETTSLYLLPEARQDQWALVVGSPAPIETMWARFTRPRSDVNVMVRDLGVSLAGVPDLPPGLVANTFFSVGIENATPEDVSAVAAIVSVQKSWLEANQVHKWAIQFNRLDDQAGRWVPHSSKRIREDQERVLFAVVIPGFSTLAIAGSPELPEQRFLVSDLAAQPATPTSGEPFEIVARVTNVGSSADIFPAILWLDRAIEAVRDVPIDAGGSVLVSFSVARPAGAYLVRLDRMVGEFTVREAPMPGITGGPAAGGPTTSTAVVLAAALGLGLVLAGAYVFGWRLSRPARW